MQLILTAHDFQNATAKLCNGAFRQHAQLVAQTIRIRHRTQRKVGSMNKDYEDMKRFLKH